ncbi:MAG: metal ABC transporter substrate-binding protein [Thermoanaerobaculia bacterium]
MQRWHSLSIAALVVLALAGPALGELSVVATTPDLGALAAAVGGNAVSVLVLAKPTEDPHYVDARPSHIVTLNRADALIEGGAELEIGWLPPLVESARNRDLQPGAPGRIVASEGVQLLDVPAVLDRSRGEIHAAGNPHFMMDPSNAGIVAGHVGDAFCRLDPGECPRYRGNLATFQTRLDEKTKEWTALLAPFAGRRVVTYHATWRYFLQRFGLRSEIYLEPKPGIPPSPPHLAEVIARMNAEGIKVILVEPYQPLRTAEAVASHTGATVVPVAQFPGALPDTDDDYIRLMDANVRAIAAALAAS